MEDYTLKNYYMLETLRKEISKFSVISFDLDDTLLLYDVLFPDDVLKPVDEYVLKSYNIAGFSYLRSEILQSMRAKCANGKDDVGYDELYDQIQAKLQFDCHSIAEEELKQVREHLFVNPVMRQVYDEAVRQHKRIFIIADSIYSQDFLSDLLQRKGLYSFEKVYSSGSLGFAKFTGKLYQNILQMEQIDPKTWLHIGDNFQSDSEILKHTGISAYFYKPLRDRYYADKAQKEMRLKEEGKEVPSEKPEENTLAHSMEKAKEINTYYTEIRMPSSETIIHVENVSMLFNLSSEKVDSIKEYVIKLIKHQLMFQEFWALKNVSFQVHKGEKIGLIGLNGSGKSTMLKIVSGVLKPTKGSVCVKGSIASLIELGAGFDFDLTAKENVFLNGAILGYSKKEMEKHYQEIIDFAVLKDFEDVPIKNFSSGMTARLGFAIATCHTPDILIIDEILSVGDFEFQKKCHAKMRELAGKGTTVLLVSHSAQEIIDMCDRVIWLDHGKIVDVGEAEFIVNKYLNRHY